MSEVCAATIREINPKDHLEKVECHMDSTYNLYRFKPSLFNQFPKSGNMHEMTIKQRIRFFFLYLHGYTVYVLEKSGGVIGCALFAKGGSYRYPFADKKDLICGPYFTVPELRGKGLGAALLKEVIDYYETEYKTIYAHIWHENIASVKCMQKVGFAEVARLHTTRITGKCRIDENGKLILVAKSKE